MADGRCRDMSAVDVIYSKQLSNVQNRCGANADGRHIGDTWRIRLNRPRIRRRRGLLSNYSDHLLIKAPHPANQGYSQRLLPTAVE